MKSLCVTIGTTTLVPLKGKCVGVKGQFEAT